MIELREVGPRDGLQSLPRLPTGFKVGLIEELSRTGLSYIEVCSFVNPLFIPQMEDADKVFRKAAKIPGVEYAVLIPSKRYYFLAREAGVKTVAVFISASELHNKRNVNRTVEETKEQIAEVVELAKSDGVRVRAYLSCTWGYLDAATHREFSAARKLAGWLDSLGVFEISVADTTGLSTPDSLKEGLLLLGSSVSAAKLALHLHCRGDFRKKVDAAIAAGVDVFDCSIGGFGGHMPDYLIGNVATEKLAGFLEERGTPAKVNVEKLEVIAAALKAKVPSAGFEEKVRPPRSVEPNRAEYV